MSEMLGIRDVGFRFAAGLGEGQKGCNHLQLLFKSSGQL